MPRSEQQQQEAPRVRPEEQPTIAEMTRLMDVAAAIRKERLTAEQQLNIGETKKLLRERLLESARVSGDPVTEQEIDAAIDAYYERLHEFRPPEPGMDTFLASLYVRRGTITKLAILVATVAAVWWSVFAFGLVGEKRTQRLVDNAYNQVQETAAVVEELAVVPDMQDRVAQLLGEATAARDAQDTTQLASLNTQLTQHATVLRQEYAIRIAAGEGQQSGAERQFTDDSGTRTSGYFLIVQAEDSSGNVLPMTIRNSETGDMVNVERWGEQVPEEVFNQMEADKQADGVVDNRTFAEKERGHVEPTVQITGPDGMPVTRGRQITQW